MELLHLAQDIPTQMASFLNMLDAGQGIYGFFPNDWSVLAQQLDTDVFAGTRNWFDNFLQSGQLWALIIGFILGYIFKGMTSYG
jgi:hypothetical protein